MPDPVAPPRVGFFEEDQGVKSSSRLLAFLLWILTAVVAGATCRYVLTATPPEAGVVGSMAGLVTALGGWGAIVHVKRNG